MSPPLANSVALAFALLGLSLDGPSARAEDLPSPWATYNHGVTAYAAADYEGAQRAWSDLGAQPLPRGLKAPVRFQLGNAQFRLGEPLEATAPEQAVELWRRSRESYRATLAIQPRHDGARHNLDLVEHRLARATHQLGRDLLDQSRQQPVSHAIDLLRTSLEHLEEAVELAPRESKYVEDRDEGRARLQERLLERARQTETRGDAAARANTEPADQTAANEYREALSDLADAARADRPESTAAPDPRVRQATDRVEQKLSQLLTRSGRRAQKEGENLAQSSPEPAFDRFDRALEDYQSAQQVEPGNQAAQTGEREVRADLEKLHVRQGRQDLKQGREELTAQRASAANDLAQALEHFEAAQELNPANAEAQQGAAEARALLPDALARQGRKEQQQGERAERESAAAALPHFEEAQSDYERALQIQPGHSPAQQGLAETQHKLEQLRTRLQKEAEQQNRQMAQLRGGKQPTLDQLLGEVQQRERPHDTQRQRQRSQNQAKPRTTYPDW